MHTHAYTSRSAAWVAAPTFHHIHMCIGQYPLYHPFTYLIGNFCCLRVHLQ